MVFINNLSKTLNSKQKNIVGISVALILIVLCLALADKVGSGTSPVFDWKDNWFIWVFFLSVIGYFEYKLFQDVN